MLESRTVLLEKLPIFQGLSPAQLASVADVSTKAFFEPDEIIIAKDAVGCAAYLLISGAAQCLDFPSLPVLGKKIWPGALVGELAMFAETVHPLTVWAIERARALVIGRDALAEVMKRDPSIAAQIAENLLARLKILTHDLRAIDGLLALAHDTVPPLAPAGGNEGSVSLFAFPKLRRAQPR
jgi:CRP-like cAMP-binding protein